MTPTISESLLRLGIGKGHKMGASQSMLSRLENDVLGNEVGLKALLIFPHKTGPN